MTKRSSRNRKNILLVQTYKHDELAFWCCMCERTSKYELPVGEYQGYPVLGINKFIQKHLEKFHPGVSMDELTEGIEDGKKRFPERGFSI